MPEGKGATAEADRERLQSYERTFRRAGLPLFSEDFSAAEDVFNRASAARAADYLKLRAKLGL